MNNEIQQSLENTMKQVVVYLDDALTYEAIEKQAKRLTSERRELERVRDQLSALLGFDSEPMKAEGDYEITTTRAATGWRG